MSRGPLRFAAIEEHMMSSPDQVSNGTAADKYFLNEKYIAYIPVLAAILALGFDVGFFYAINISFFTLFSLSEHILFALQALPVAMIFLFAVTMVLGGTNFIVKSHQPTSSPVVSSRGLKIIALIFFILLTIALLAFLIYVIYIGVVSNPPSALTLVILPLALLTLAVEPKFKVIYYLLSVISVCLIVSFAFGVSFGSSYVNPAAEGALKPKVLSVVNLKDRPALIGQIIRSGERGVLLYIPASDRIRFELWSSINSIETTR